MTIITVITDEHTTVETGLRSSEILKALELSHKRSTFFIDETHRKLSNALSGMIPSFKGNTEVAFVPHAGMNP